MAFEQMKIRDLARVIFLAEKTIARRRRTGVWREGIEYKKVKRRFQFDLEAIKQREREIRGLRGFNYHVRELQQILGLSSWAIMTRCRKGLWREGIEYSLTPRGGKVYHLDAIRAWEKAHAETVRKARVDRCLALNAARRKSCK